MAGKRAVSQRRLANMFTHLGCYADKEDDRIFGSTKHWSENMTPEVSACKFSCILLYNLISSNILCCIIRHRR